MTRTENTLFVKLEVHLLAAPNLWFVPSTLKPIILVYRQSSATLERQWNKTTELLHRPFEIIVRVKHIYVKRETRLVQPRRPGSHEQKHETKTNPP